MASQNRVTIENLTVRFYQIRAEAIRSANNYTRVRRRQHDAVQAFYEGISQGWLVCDVTNNKLYDTDGALPASLSSVLKTRS